MKHQHLGNIALLVRDYDEAKAWYCDVLGFNLIEDTPLPDGKRWLLVAPPGSTETRLLLARAVNPEQAKRVGDQTGGRVFLFLHTDDFRRDFLAMRGKGVHFCEEPRQESYGMVAVFEDLYGNRWDLLQLARLESFPQK
jgi:catechol 2,3-dioxygenase-like lactoylglutathione lyase family enzyme